MNEGKRNVLIDAVAWIYFSLTAIIGFFVLVARGGRSGRANVAKVYCDHHVFGLKRTSFLVGLCRHGCGLAIIVSALIGVGVGRQAEFNDHHGVYAESSDRPVSAQLGVSSDASRELELKAERVGAEVQQIREASTMASANLRSSGSFSSDERGRVILTLNSRRYLLTEIADAKE